MIKQAISIAEKEVEKSASQQAYLATESITHPVIQRQSYILVRESIIIGARLMQEKLMKITDKESSSNDDVNVLASFSYDLAIKRGKTGLNLSLKDICNGIGEELEELRNATEKQSKHIPPDYTEQQEELADVILAALTAAKKNLRRKMLCIRCIVCNRLNKTIENIKP